MSFPSLEHNPWINQWESSEEAESVHHEIETESLADEQYFDARDSSDGYNQLSTAFSALTIGQPPVTFSALTTSQEDSVAQQSTDQAQPRKMENTFSYRFSLGPYADTFSGNPGENLTEWIISTNFLLEAFEDWSGAQQVRAVYPLLRGNARSWFNGVRGTPDEPRNWEELANQLVKVFRTEQHMYQYEERLDKIKQADFTNLEQYFAAFQALARELQDMPKRHLVYKFAKGLTNANVRHAIYNTANCNLQRAYEIASSHALGIRAANPNLIDNNYDDGVAPMELDAMSGARNRNQVICYNCQQPGHLARSCRQRRNKPRRQQQQQQQPHNQGKRQGQLRNIDAITDEEWQMILQYRQLRNGNANDDNNNNNGEAVQQENFRGQ
jgi:hypothetical protein